MKWYILLTNGDTIEDFDFEDEYSIRQAVFAESGEWPQLVGKSQLCIEYFTLKPKRWVRFFKKK